MFSFEDIFKNDVFRQIARISPIFWRKPSLALGDFSNKNFASRENTGHVCPNPAQELPQFSLFLGKKLYLLAQGHFDREKKIGPKTRKTFFLVASAVHKANYGRALNATGIAELRRQAAHRAGASDATIADDRRCEESRGSAATIIKLQAHIAESAAQAILDQKALRDAEDAAALVEKG